MTLDAAPGDVLAVTNGGIWGWVVRLGEWLQGKPNLSNHVVVVTHRDELGRWIGISGQPGGVALCDCTPYLSSKLTRSNRGQPRPNDTGQLDTFLASCAKSLGIAYDWVAIAEDALAVLRLYDVAAELDHLWRWPNPGAQLPGHVVCSSIAARLYQLVGWKHPNAGSERESEPADWWVWADRQRWLLP